MTRFSALLVVPFVTAALGGQNPAPPTAGPQKLPTALIVGQLVDGSSGSPVAGAMMSLSPPPAPRPVGPDGIPLPAAPGPPAQPTRVLTDGTGRFVFHSLPAGSYSLSAARPGYIQSAYGQTAPAGGRSRRIDLTDGQRLANVSVKIWKYASLSGRLADEAGEPVVGAHLLLLQFGGPSGASQYSLQSSAETDDRGTFRFPQLYPGDYLICVPSTIVSVPTAVVDEYLDANAGGAAANRVRMEVQGSGGTLSPNGLRIDDTLVQTSGIGVGTPAPLMVGAAGKLTVYPMTLYPGVRTAASATAITLQSGEERKGVDFAIKPVPAATVSGRVIRPDGPAANMTVKLTTGEFEGVGGGGPFSEFDAAWVITRSDGSFKALGIPAGDYVASVFRVPGFSSGFNSLPPSDNDPLLWGRTPVSVGEAGVEGVTIQLAHGLSLSGRVEFEPGLALPPTPAQLQQARLIMTPLAGGRATPVGTITADGLLKTQELVPAKYNLVMTLPTAGWTLKSVTVGGRNMLNQTLDLTASDLSGVVLTYTDKAGQISGTVSLGADDVNAAVLLFPADFQAWIQSGMSTGLLAVPVSQAGTFQMSGVLAGDYVILATTAASLPRYPTGDPQAMMALARKGTKITIGDREKRVLALTVVKAPHP